MKVLRRTNNWCMDKILFNLPAHLVGFNKDEIKDCIARSFHLLARQQGSCALWLTHDGILITRDDDEFQRGYLYEDWLQAAIQTSLEQHAIKTDCEDECQPQA